MSQMAPLQLPAMMKHLDVPIHPLVDAEVEV